MESPENSGRPLSILVLGESGTGKTCFTDMFTTGKHFVYYDPMTSEKRENVIVVDNIRYSVCLSDFSTTVRGNEDGDIGYYQGLLEKAYETCDGVVLLCSLIDKASFENITKDEYLRIILNRKRVTEPSSTFPHQLQYPAGQQRFGCILVGNKADLAQSRREVDEEVAQAWAESHGMDFFEVDSNKQELIEEAIRALVRSINRARRWDAEDLEEELERMKQHSANGNPEEATRPLLTKASP